MIVAPKRFSAHQQRSYVKNRGATVEDKFGPALTPDGRPHPNAARRPTILYFYGNGMCLKGTAYEFGHFRRLGANVLIPEYVGYGLSGGQAGEVGCRETADAAYDHLSHVWGGAT